MPVDTFERHVQISDTAMRRLAYRLVGAAVDDVLQVAYLAAFRSRHDFRGDAKFETWLYRIVYNSCLNELRSRDRLRTTSLDDSIAELASTNADPAMIGTNRADLASALASLSADQRAAVLLVDAERMSYREAAEVLDLAPGTVASRVSRARQILRHQLEENAE